MKKYKSIGKLLAVSFLTAAIASACTEDAMDKINENPNNPLDAPAKFLITDLGVSTAFSTVGGDSSLYSSVYIEHETGISNQLYRAEVRSGEPTTATTYNNAWINVYSNIKNAKIVIKKCEEDPSEKGNVVTEAIAKILLAYNGAVAGCRCIWKYTVQPDWYPQSGRHTNVYAAQNRYAGKHLSGSDAESG